MGISASFTLPRGGKAKIVSSWFGKRGRACGAPVAAKSKGPPTTFRHALGESRMKKAVLTMVAVVAAAGLMLGSSAPANARPKYKMAFDAEYMKEGSAMHKALNGTSNCNVCHQGKDRKNRNDLGKAIQKALGEDKNIMDMEKINAAIAKGAKDKAPKSEKTFADLLKDGSWKPTTEEP
jgi:hypothetical protein